MLLLANLLALLLLAALDSAHAGNAIYSPLCSSYTPGILFRRRAACDFLLSTEIVSTAKLSFQIARIVLPNGGQS
jgi:hypothetical protein